MVIALLPLLILCAVLVVAYLAAHLYPLLAKWLKLRKWAIYAISFLAVVAVLLPLIAIRSVILGGIAYLCVALFCADILRLIAYAFARGSAFRRVFNRFYAPAAILVAAVIGIFGYMNVFHTTVTPYNIRMDKLAGSLRIALVSDVHLGSGVDSARLEAIVNDINTQAPDIVLLCGDIIVEDTTREQVGDAMQAFSNLTAPAYYVLGNHEYFTNIHGYTHGEIAGMMKDAGVTPLKDAYTLINNQFYLVGRDDALNTGRASLDALLDGLDGSLPVIVMDHQPKELAVPARLEVDLQVSGHTHAGQLFPLGQALQLIGYEEMNYGLRTDGATHIIVSSGIGVTGIPMRVGSPSEIVVINING